jgi:hypothetical protein
MKKLLILLFALMILGTTVGATLNGGDSNSTKQTKQTKATKAKKTTATKKTSG